MSLVQCIRRAIASSSVNSAAEAASVGANDDGLVHAERLRAGVAAEVTTDDVVGIVGECGRRDGSCRRGRARV